MSKLFDNNSQATSPLSFEEGLGVRQLKIIKIGGNIIDNPSELTHFIELFSKIEGNKILVHGGGKLATKMATDIGLTPVLIDGRRITDAKMLDVVTMVYAGQINKNIVAQLQAKSTHAIGLSGADGNAIESEKRNHPTIDYGFVGDVQKINAHLISKLIDSQLVPVFCAITHDKKGQLLNTNADTIASELAVALSAIYEVTLIYCFEKNGVLLDSEDNSSVIPNMNSELYAQLKEEKKVHSGMIPKLDNCFNALKNGVRQIKIGHHSMLENSNAACTKINL
jgi:acetylglutamate kinase